MPDRPNLPVCSVCIANYNGGDFLIECLDSVHGQATSFDFEIVLHDDASTDGSIELVRSRYPSVRTIESADNVGFCVSNNRMVQEARGRYVLLLNNDACLRPGALQALFDARGGDEQGKILSLSQYDASNGDLIDRGYDPDPFLYAVPNLDSNRTAVGVVHGACLWIEKKLWNELGGFPSWFVNMAEDLLLCCALRLRGGSIEVPVAAGFDHRVGQSFGGGKFVHRSIRTTRVRRAWSERNRIFVLIATYPFPWMQVFLPIHLAVLVAEGLVLSLMLRDRRLWREVYKKALFEAWTHRKRAWQLRRRLQTARTVSALRFFSTSRWFPAKLAAWLRYGLPRVS
ncbi:MAG: glycosyltransferase [Acidobacteria bacterium]|nr:MAG: glycosyltransferase [Acidobacteriota bacterium]REK09793.1 MAG: glycosyltransferase [Acidobacteriota bacterium]